MSIILNLTVLPILGVFAIFLMYSQIGFFVAFLIAVRRTFQYLGNIKFVIQYIFAVFVISGIGYFLLRLTFWVGNLADHKLWGYLSSIIISTFTAWRIVPHFISAALTQTKLNSIIHRK